MPGQSPQSEPGQSQLGAQQKPDIPVLWGQDVLWALQYQKGLPDALIQP